jgi:hypothetical protein
LGELADWDSFLLNQLDKIGKGHNFAQHLRRGLLVGTDFSGYDSPREGLRVLLLAAASKFHIDTSGVRFVRSFDNGAMQRTCLEFQSDSFDNGAACVFGDIKTRLTPQGMDWVNSAMPSKQTPLSQALIANEAIQHFLQDNRNTVFKKDTVAFCYKHRMSCPVYPAHAWNESKLKGGSSTCVSKRLDDGPPPRKLRREGSTQTLSPPWWQTLKSFDDDGTEKEPLMASIAGLLCIDWTGWGNRPEMQA